MYLAESEGHVIIILIGAFQTGERIQDARREEYDESNGTKAEDADGGVDEDHNPEGEDVLKSW